MSAAPEGQLVPSGSGPERVPSPGLPTKYAAFISYSHAPDRRLARTLRRMLETFGVALPFRRRMRVFLDESSLSANPDLWGAIQSALDASGAFLLLASPTSARSPWVQREVKRFLEHHPPERLCLVLTEGWTPWTDAAERGVDPARCAVSRELTHVLHGRGWEPLVIDLRPFVREPRGLLRPDRDFSSAVASIASFVLGKDKDEVFGEHLRARRWLMGAAFLLVAVLASLTWGLRREAHVAAIHRTEANSRELITRAEAQLRDGDPQSGLALLKQAHGLDKTEAVFPVLEQWVSSGARLQLGGHTGAVTSVSFSPDGRDVLTASDDGTARIWSSESGRTTLILRGHAGSIWSASYSPSGERVVTASVDGTAMVWDARSGRRIAVLTGHSDRVTAALFNSDGRRVLTASDDGTARLWDSDSGVSRIVFSGHAAPLLALDISWDDQKVLTADEGGTARLWDASSGRCLAVLPGHSGPVLSAAFSPDGDRVVTSGQDGTVKLWSGRTGKRLFELAGHTAAVRGAAFSPDGRRILTNSDDGTARAWDATSGRLLATFHGHSGAVEKAAFSRDGLSIVTAGEDRTVRLWEATSGRLLATFTGHTGKTWDVAFSPDGGRVVSASTDGTARVWDAFTSHRTTILGRPAIFETARFSDDDGWIITASERGSVQVWNRDSGDLHATLADITGMTRGAVLYPSWNDLLITDSNRVALIWDTAGHVWDVATRIVRPPPPPMFRDRDPHVAMCPSLEGLREHLGERYGAFFDLPPARWSSVFSQNGDRLVVPGETRRAEVLRFPSMHLVCTLPESFDTARSVAFSHSGERLVTAGPDNAARIWNSNACDSVTILSGHSRPVRGASFSPDGRQVLTFSNDETARLWEVPSGKLRAVLSGHSTPIWAASFSPDGRSVLTAGDWTARLWDASTGQPLIVFKGHAKPVTTAAFSPDGRYVVTASQDGTARVWETASGKTIAELVGHSRTVRDASFSHDGLRIVTASADGTAIVWQDVRWAPRSAQLEILDLARPLTFEERRLSMPE